MPWLTPDSAIGELRAYRVFIPFNEGLEAAYKGLLLDLERSQNWEQHGAQTVEDVTDAWSQANDLNLRLLPIMPAGTVLWGAYADIPDGFLACDGSEYSTTDYAELFQAIGYAWGGSGTVFNVPNLVDRFAVGAGGGISLADTGGEKEHSLASTEIPQLVGEISSIDLFPVQAGAGTFALALNIPQSYPVIFYGQGNAHNNMPPYAGLTPVIAYR